MLTTKQIISLDKLGEIEGKSSENVRIARMILLDKGENPANDARVLEVLNMDLDDYLELGADVFNVLGNLDAIAYTYKGKGKNRRARSASVGEIEIRRFTGEDLFVFDDMDMVDLIQRFTGLSKSKVQALEPGTYLALSSAINFLAQECLGARTSRK